MPQVVEISGGAGLGRKLTSKTRRAIPSKEFGLPGQRKYPMENITHAVNAKARASEELHRGKLTKGQWKKITDKANKFIRKYKKEGQVYGLSLGSTSRSVIKSTRSMLKKATVRSSRQTIKLSLTSLAEGKHEAAGNLALSAALQAGAIFKKHPDDATKIISTARGVIRMAIRMKALVPMRAEISEKVKEEFAIAGPLGKAKAKKKPKKATKKKRTVSKKTLAILKKGREKRMANLKKKKKAVKRTVSRTARKSKKRVTRRRKK